MCGRAGPVGPTVSVPCDQLRRGHADRLGQAIDQLEVGVEGPGDRVEREALQVGEALHVRGEGLVGASLGHERDGT